MRNETILISPKRAKEFLDKNTLNRPIRETYVTFLAEEMTAGRWRQNTGETIKISKSDELLDGQHRLLAVIKSGLSFRFEVVFDLDKSIIDVIDCGLKRTAGDVLSMRGAEHANLKASIIKSWLSNMKGGGPTTTGISNRQIEDFYFQSPDYWDTITKMAASWAKFKGLSPTFFGFCYAMTQKKSGHAAKGAEFFNGLCSGKDVPETVIDLRNKLINDRISTRKLTPAAKIDLVRHHWNAFIKGKKYSRSIEGWL